MPCLICSSEEEPFLIYQMKASETGIYKCPDCGIVYSYPSPLSRDLENYYNGMYSEGAKKISNERLSDARKTVNEYLKKFKKLGKRRYSESKLRILDLGGGLGYYSAAFSEIGYEVTYVEQDPISFGFAKKNFNFSSLFNLSCLEFLAKKNDYYDIVLFRHVIEHCVNPVLTINAISKRIKKGGSLIVETDNNRSIELLLRPSTFCFYWRLYRQKFKKITLLNLLLRRPFAIDPPRHLFAFNKYNLSIILKRAGLNPYLSFSYRTGNPFYWANLSVLKKCNLKSLRYPKKIIINLIDLILLPLRLFLERLGLGAGLCIFVIKE